METILIAGGTGLVGTYLSKILVNKGYKLNILSTNRKKCDSKTIFYWNPDTQEIDENALHYVDYMINLAGANIAERRWTDTQKKIIIDSRTKSTQLLFDTLQKNKKTLKAFISSSATGYYGSITSPQIFTETDLPATDFLGKTCKQWEDKVTQFHDLNIRTVTLRTGIVLSKHGGALKKIIIPIKLGIGSALGNGKQFFPWIHIDDLTSIYLKAIEDKGMSGIYNAVAPNYITNNNFIKALAKHLHKPFFAPNVPSFILKLVLGEMSTLLLDGSRISSKKIIEANYQFKYPTIETALEDLLK